MGSTSMFGAFADQSSTHCQVVKEFGERARQMVEEATAAAIKRAEEERLEARGHVAGAKAVTERLLERIVALELENATLRRRLGPTP